MAQLKSDWSEGEIFSAGTITNTSGLNAITNRINTHDHYGGDTHRLSESLLYNRNFTLTSTTNACIGSILIPAGSFFNGDGFKIHIYGHGDHSTNGSIALGIFLSGEDVGYATGDGVIKVVSYCPTMGTYEIGGCIGINGSFIWAYGGRDTFQANFLNVSYSGTVSNPSPIVVGAFGFVAVGRRFDGTIKIIQQNSSGLLG